MLLLFHNATVQLRKKALNETTALLKKLLHSIQFPAYASANLYIGHNVAFDIRFLQTACTKLRLPQPSFQAVDTVLLARSALNNCVANFRLETLARYFDLAKHQTHRALPDARLTALLYLKLNEKR